MSKDPFLEMVKKKDEEKKKAFRDALLFAKSEAQSESAKDFVADCARFFKERGFLTKKQVEALYSVDQNRGRAFAERSWEECEEYDSAGGLWDLPADWDLWDLPSGADWDPFDP